MVWLHMLLGAWRAELMPSTLCVAFLLQKKRAGKARRSAKDEERAARAVSQGGTAPLAGRKSESAEQAARKVRWAYASSPNVAAWCRLMP